MYVIKSSIFVSVIKSYKFFTLLNYPVCDIIIILSSLRFFFIMYIKYDNSFIKIRDVKLRFVSRYKIHVLKNSITEQT